jgi:hypothetical protein
MGSTRVTTPAPPPPPAPVDPYQSSIDFTRSMLQMQPELLAAEQQFRPQYIDLELADINRLMQGTEGQMGLLGLEQLATQQASQSMIDALRQQRQADIADVEALGGRASAAFMAANPQLAAAMQRAEGLQGMGGAGIDDALMSLIGRDADQVGGIQGTPLGQQIQGQIGQLGGVGAQQIAQPGAITAQQIAQPDAIQAQQIAGLSGSEIEARIQQQIDSLVAEGVDPVEAAQIAQTQLGQGLQQAGMSQLQAGAGEQQLGQAAQDYLGRGGQLTPLQARNAEQQARMAGVARGRELGQDSIYQEMQNRMAQEMDLERQNMAMGAGLLGQQFGMEQQRLGMAGGLYGQDMQRAAQNAAMQQQASLANQQAGLTTQGMNLQAGQAGLSALMGLGQMDQQAQLANQAAALQAAGMSQDAALRAAMANQSASLQASGMSQDASLRAAMANQSAGLQAAGINQQGIATGLSSLMGLGEMDQRAALSNQQARLQQQGMGIQGLMGLGQLQQQRLGQERGFALDLVGAQQRVASDPFQAILGRPSTAPGMGMASTQYAGGMASQPMGPNLFDPNAGINLALQQNQNLANYQSSIFGSQAALAGAQAQAKGAMMGGLFQGLGSLFGCWVAREVYGEDNPDWMRFREWLYNKAPRWFRALYLKYGERFAAFIKDKPKLKSLIKKWMDGRIN